MARFEREKLQAFVMAGEKSPPPVFVGREDIIGDIEERGRLAWKSGARAAHGEAGATRVIQGAPGAGKSSILAELEFRSLKAGGERAPRVLFLTSEMLEESLPNVLARLEAAGRMERGEWFEHGRDLWTSAVKQVTSVSVAGAGIDLAQREWSGLEELRNALPPDRWVRPVIVAVDEAQNLPAEKNTPLGHFFRGIHNGRTGLPLTLVLAGLGDTGTVANQIGLTRGLKIRQLGCLDSGDSGKLMRRFCRHFRMDPEGQGERLDGLARDTEGWPRHLHIALQSLGREALTAEGDLSRIDWHLAASRAAEDRVRHYYSQQSPAMKDSKGLTASVMRDLDGRLDRADILGLIRTHVRDGTGHELPRSMSAHDFREHLVHQGALHERDDGSFHCPIPSFRNFLIEAGGPEAVNNGRSQSPPVVRMRRVCPGGGFPT